MFVKDKRDEAFLKIKSGSKKHLFLKDLMWGKKARAKQAYFEQKRLDELQYQEQRHRSIMARLQNRHSPTTGVHGEMGSGGGNNASKAKAKVAKNRFVQERQLGKIETEKDGYVASRYVQPATTKNAGKLAPWSAANPLSSEKAYSAQVFPLWDEETVGKNISKQYLSPHKSTQHGIDNGQQQVQEDQLPSIKASDARTETTSWSLQKYGVGTELSVSAASAIVLAMKYNLSICCLGEGCSERNVNHFRAVRHVHLEPQAENIVRIEMLSRKYAGVKEDGFVTHDHYYHAADVSKSLTSIEFRASALPISPVRRPIGPSGCKWTRIKMNPVGDYEGYVQTKNGILPHGRGTMVWRDGNVYRGDWYNGQMHGELGEYWSAVDKSLYRGNWYKGKREGQGEYWLDGENRQGERYKGGFINGEFAGHGEYRLASGRTLYVGEWEHDEWHGEGVVYWRNGNVKYDGAWKRGVRHGLGKWCRSNGVLAYRGYFQNGKYHGRGKFFNPRERKTTGWASGQWVCGELTGSDCEVTFYVAGTIFVHFMGNVDRGRICGYGKVQYPDKRVCHGVTQRVRLPLVRALGQDARHDREDNTLWSNEGQCWVGGAVEEGYVNPLAEERNLIMASVLKKRRKGKELTQEEKDVAADLEEQGGAAGGGGGDVKGPGTAVHLLCTGTIIFLDDARYDGESVNGMAHGPYGVRIGPQGRCSYGTFEHGRCTTEREAIEGVAWRLVVYKCKTATQTNTGQKLIGYRNGSRLFDLWHPMSASGALWLWFSKQDRGIFGGDKIRDRFGPTMRSAQLEMMFEIVKRKRHLCGTVQISKLKTDTGSIKLLRRGCDSLAARKEFTSVFEFVRGDTVWPDGIQETYRQLVFFLRGAIGKQ